MSAGFQMTELSFTVPLPSLMPSGYFRSKLFSSHAASNPIVAAASPLLSLLERLSVCQSLPNIDPLRDNIEHELFAFHSRLNSQHFSEEIIALGHYLLCATIDELVGKNYLRLNGEPTTFKSFTPSSTNELGPETQFFVIVSHLKDRATHYLDLLELSYYCLIAGFEGEHHFKTDGRQLLEKLIDDIHKIIQQYREYKPQVLFEAHAPTHSEPPENHKSLITILGLSLSILLASYIGTHQLINHQAHKLLHRYSLQTEVSR